jgi:cyanobactin maturation PatA/PatG family protease
VIDALVPGLADLWTETTGDERVCIAILDGPVDLDHAALAGAHLSSALTVPRSTPSTGLATQHGTRVASILFGSHEGAVEGIAPHCRGVIVPIFQDVRALPPVSCSQVDLARAINQAVQARADIINISGGEFSPSGTAHPILADAVRNCASADVLIVAAAGNQGCECLNIPAGLPAVLSVGAMGTDGEPLDYSNWGGAYLTQGVLAPGDNILAASPDGGGRPVSGTSYATPIVAGAVALLMSLHWIRHGTRLSPLTVRDAILQTAVHCGDRRALDCPRLLGGRLDLPRATASLFPVGGPSMSDNEPRPEPIPTVNSAAPTPPQDAISESPGDTFPMAATRATESETTPRGLVPSGSGGSCGCGCNAGTGGPAQLVYALGRLGFDFGTEARRDGLIQVMDEPKPGTAANPYDPAQLLAYLQKNPFDAASVIWTLTIEATTVYAIRPSGPFGSIAYDRLHKYLGEQVAGVSEMVSIPGVLAGSVRLFSGQVVPAVVPEIRGMYNWSKAALITSVAGPEPGQGADKSGHQQKVAAIHNFLNRVYFELRNLGQTPQNRAINFSATNAFNIEKVYEQAIKEKMELDSIDVERSLVCRPDSDCWDVKLMFFFPERQVQTVRKAYRFTIDVSDVVPVTVGPIRSWFVR